MSAAGKRHMARVATLPCKICKVLPVEVHHIRDLKFCGAGQKAGHWYTFPLCRKHHSALHAGIKTWEMQYGPQVGHVEDTLEILYDQ